MPNITSKSCFYGLYYYPQKFCNFHVQVFQIKLQYYCSKPIKLQKFLVQQYKLVYFSGLKYILDRQLHHNSQPAGSRSFFSFCYTCRENSCFLAGETRAEKASAPRRLHNARKSDNNRYLFILLFIIYLLNTRSFTWLTSRT